MSFSLTLDDLLAYSDWDREKWHAWFREQGPNTLTVELGPNTDGRFKNVGELIRHIFMAEKRYIERCLKAPLTDSDSVPIGGVDSLFALGIETRRALRELLATFPDAEWEAPREMAVGAQVWKVTPRKMILQAITHELRHWAQIATFLRLAGRKSGSHDLIGSLLFNPPGWTDV